MFVVVVVLLAKTFGSTPVGPSSFSVASFAARGHFVPTAFPFLSPSEWSVAGDTDFALDVPSSVQDGFYDVHAGKLSWGDKGGGFRLASRNGGKVAKPSATCQCQKRKRKQSLKSMSR